MTNEHSISHLRLRISLQGTVQGFGLCPTVYRIAQRLRLTGFVRNVDAGVEIEIEGGSEQIEGFLCQFKLERPATAVVTTEGIQRVASLGSPWFEILPGIRAVSPSGSKTASPQSRAEAHFNSQTDR